MSRRKPLRILFLILYTVVGSLILFEVFLRVLDPIGIVYYFDAARYFEAMRPDPDYGYIHTARYRARLQGVDVVINGEGFRGPDFDVQKAPGTRRLMILGDSVVFGWGAPQDSIFATVISDRLTARGWEVIAAGVGSWNTRAEYEFLKKRGIQYAPDVLVLVIVANDVEPSSAGGRVQQHDAQEAPLWQRVVRRLARYSYTVSTFYHVLRQRDTSDRLVDLYQPDSAAWSDARDALDGIITLCHDNGTALVAFLYGDLKTDFSKAFYAAYGGYLRDRGIAVYSFEDEIYDRGYRNSVVDGHPNAAAHRLIAEQMLRVLPLSP